VVLVGKLHQKKKLLFQYSIESYPNSIDHTSLHWNWKTWDLHDSNSETCIQHNKIEEAQRGTLKILKLYGRGMYQVANDTQSQIRKQDCLHGKWKDT
jgi:hypothetical protein